MTMLDRRLKVLGVAQKKDDTEQTIRFKAALPALFDGVDRHDANKHEPNKVGKLLERLDTGNTPKAYGE